MSFSLGFISASFSPTFFDSFLCLETFDDFVFVLEPSPTILESDVDKSLSAMEEMFLLVDLISLSRLRGKS